MLLVCCIASLRLHQIRKLGFKVEKREIPRFHHWLIMHYVFQ